MLRQPCSNRSTMKLRILSLLAGFVIVVSLIYPALAREAFFEHMRKMYKLPDAIASCHLCHQYDETKKQKARGYNLNDFGKDIDNLPHLRKFIDVEEGHTYTDAEWKDFEKGIHMLDDEDSDNDGATNLEELTLGTFPGDKTSVPDAEALKKLRAKKDEK
jgi:hypothetical protein